MQIAPAVQLGSRGGVTPLPAIQDTGAISAAPQCGTQRWAVKTMSDAAAGQVNLTPQPTTVAALTSLPAFVTDGGNLNPPRRPGAEMQVWQVRANLVQLQLESDSDIHLVLSDPANPSVHLIAEFPSDACVATKDPALRAQMAKARADLLAQTGIADPPQYPLPPVALSGTAVLTGVGFFDDPHGQSGDAPNSIELHPVLSFAKQ